MPTDQTTEPAIAAEYYFRAAEGVAGNLEYDSNAVVHQALTTLTFCVLVLSDGRTITGESSYADPELFTVDLGRQAARANAIDKVNVALASA